jgi:hypothetical protein
MRVCRNSERIRDCSGKPTARRKEVRGLAAESPTL